MCSKIPKIFNLNQDDLKEKLMRRVQLSPCRQADCLASPPAQLSALTAQKLVTSVLVLLLGRIYSYLQEQA